MWFDHMTLRLVTTALYSGVNKSRACSSRPGGGEAGGYGASTCGQ